MENDKNQASQIKTLQFLNDDLHMRNEELELYVDVLKEKLLAILVAAGLVEGGKRLKDWEVACLVDQFIVALRSR